MATKYNVLFLVAIAVVLVAIPRQLVGIFTEDDAEALRYGADCLRIVGYGYGFYAVGVIMMQAFNGAGDTVTPTWLNAICFWLLQLPLAYALAAMVSARPARRLLGRGDLGIRARSARLVGLPPRHVEAQGRLNVSSAAAGPRLAPRRRH